MAEEKMENRKLNRREVLKLGAGLAAAGALAACGSPAAPAPAPAANAPAGASGAAPAPASGAAKPAAGATPGAPAVVGQKSLKMALWVGSFAKAVRETIVPDFEKDHGVKVLIEEGISADALAKVRTTRSSPEFTIIGVDDQYIPEVRAEGLVVKMTPEMVPNMKNMFPEYIIDEGHGLGIAVGWNTVHYNTEKIKTPPTSWEVYFDPAYKGRYVLQTPKAGTGIQHMAAFAALELGKSIKEAQYQSEAAFARYKRSVPTAHSVVDSSAPMVPLLAQGEVWFYATTSRLFGEIIAKGAPVARAELKEGAFMLLNSVALVKGAPLQELGADFINRILSDKGQLAMAKAAYTGPVTKTVTLPDDLKKLVPVGEADAKAMVRLDWDHIIKNRAAWIDRWNKEIAS